MERNCLSDLFVDSVALMQGGASESINCSVKLVACEEVFKRMTVHDFEPERLNFPT